MSFPVNGPRACGMGKPREGNRDKETNGFFFALVQRYEGSGFRTVAEDDPDVVCFWMQRPFN